MSYTPESAKPFLEKLLIPGILLGYLAGEERHLEQVNEDYTQLKITNDHRIFYRNWEESWDAYIFRPEEEQTGPFQSDWDCVFVELDKEFPEDNRVWYGS